MGEAARRQDDHVVDMVEYLRDTLAEIDATIADLERRRTGIAVRLAVIAASNDPGIESAVADYSTRVEENRPYESAEDANKLIMEAHARFIE